MEKHDLSDFMPSIASLPQHQGRFLLVSHLSSLIPRAYYEARFAHFSLTHYREPTILPYKLLIEALADTEFWLSKPHPYTMSRLQVVSDGSGTIVPYYVVHDEDPNTNNGEPQLIPVLPLDQACEDYVDFWVGGLDLDSYNLEYVARGLSLCLIPSNREHLKRWERYRKRIVSVVYADTEQSPFLFEDLFAKLLYILPLAAEKWRERHDYDFDLDQTFATHLPHIQSPQAVHHIVQVIQETGIGYGVFTQYRSDELYWNYTVHDSSSHIGNNVLLCGLDLADKLGLTLNLGIGYFDWKEAWSKGTHRFQAGIRFKQGERSC